MAGLNQPRSAGPGAFTSSAAARRRAGLGPARSSARLSRRPAPEAADRRDLVRAAGGDALLVKYLFTAERLSIQVHPDDAAPRAGPSARQGRGLVRALDAEPGATIGLGLREPVSREALRAAALDGSIEQLLDWRPVDAGDFFYSPAGTIHAIGGGISLIEIQQNLDLTYRLYDYGRPRELHLDEAMAVATPGALVAAVRVRAGRDPRGGRRLRRRALDGGRRIRGDAVVVPLASGGSIDGEPLAAGGVWLVEAGAASPATASTCWSLPAPYDPPELRQRRGSTARERRAW